jgi:hypothetical protein
MKEYHKKFSDKDFKDLMTRMEEATKSIKQINEGDELRIYNSEEVCSRLDISEALLSQYRQDRLLPYSKYFYTDEYVEEFIMNTSSNTL